MNVFTEKQPKDGDQVLLCEHASDEKCHCHFFNLPEGLVFVRPDGTGGNAKWIVICEECFAKYPDPSLQQLMAYIVRSDATWKGDEPEIKVNPRMN